MPQVGQSVPRLEARAKVTGRAEYAYHLSLPGMLHGKIFRSTVAHGRIRNIDITAAARLPGVHRVVTIDDIIEVIPDPYYGPAFHDQPILAHEKVRHVGEPVAVVLAEDPHVAEQAVSLIAAEYEELPAVFDEVLAMDSSAVVHDALKPAGTFADLKHLAGRRDTNIALDFKLRRGDVAPAFAAAARVFEHTFRVPPNHGVPFEPFVSVAELTGGGITIHTASQMPSFVRLEIARLLGWPESKVRIKVAQLGGGFGAKTYIKFEALVAALALIARRPVRIAATMDEQFTLITNHPATFRIKSGVDRDGRVTARECEVFWNGGAYADIGPRISQKSGFTAPGPYDIDNVKIDSYEVYTNQVPAGALRGFGIPQLVWAYESHTDMVARGLGIDPIEFRRRNMLREGRPHATGTVMRGAAIGPVLDTLADTMNWRGPFDRGAGTVRRGRGVAIGIKAVISPTASVALVNINADGSVTLSTSTVDMGQGSDTAMAQIAAEVLDVEAGAIRVVHPDTDVTPFDVGTLGSRSTFHMGHAVRLAAQDARARLAALAAEADLPAGTNYPPSEIFQKRYGMQAGNVIGSGTYIPDYRPPDNVTPFWMIGGSGVELEVDTETGHVRVTRLVNVVDCGTPINPRIVHTQISGAAIMALGQALFESMLLDGGQITNASLADYKIAGINDIPPMESVFVEAAQGNGPFGAKAAARASRSSGVIVTCAAAMPGTVSTATLALRQAATCGPVGGAPPISRTTRRPLLASPIIRPLISS
jgi:CO/xanthine dehydrogenase Mo-binding subunit